MSTKQKVIDSLSKVFDIIEGNLPDPNRDKTMKVEEMLQIIGASLNLDKSNMRLIDPTVRLYFKHDDVWTITPGANGGIRLRTSVKKSNKKTVSPEVMEQVNAMIKAKLDSNLLSDDDDID
jgi:hypothetical protein